MGKILFSEFRTFRKSVLLAFQDIENTLEKSGFEKLNRPHYRVLCSLTGRKLWICSFFTHKKDRSFFEIRYDGRKVRCVPQQVAYRYDPVKFHLAEMKMNLQKRGKQVSCS